MTVCTRRGGCEQTQIEKFDDYALFACISKMADDDEVQFLRFELIDEEEWLHSKRVAILSRRSFIRIIAVGFMLNKRVEGKWQKLMVEKILGVTGGRLGVYRAVSALEVFFAEEQGGARVQWTELKYGL